MSINRICPNCFREDDVRINFGPNFKAEDSFHKHNWCNCGYKTPEEMMKDQDMGFSDPNWVRIAKDFV